MRSLTKTLVCLFATLPSTHAATIILGDQSGEPRGANALDVQSFRDSLEKVAFGDLSVAVGASNGSYGSSSIAFGIANLAVSSDTLALGRNNHTEGSLSMTVGSDNTILASDYYRASAAFGYANVIGGSVGYGSATVAPNSSVAFGTFNYVYGSYSASFGQENTIGEGADWSFIAGEGNSIWAVSAVVFGMNIVNQIPNSLMIGPSDSAKVTILSSGNVGIGTIEPSQKLEVVGNAKISGSLSVGGSPVLTAAGGNGANLTGLNASNISTGSLAASLLPGSVVQLSGSQTLSNKTLSNAALTGSTTLGGSTSAQQATFNANGFLGINVSPPADYIHIKTSALQRDGGITLQTYTDNQAEIRFQDLTGAYRWALGFSDGAAKDFRLANSHALHVAPMLTVLNGSGNVGINTTAPRNKLDVMGASNATYGGRNILGDDGNYNPVIKQHRWTGVNSDYYSSAITTVGDGGGVALLKLQVGAGLTPLGSEALNDVMVLKGNGNVGIGTSSPATKLEVAGTVRSTGLEVAGNIRSTGSDITLTGTGTDYLSITNVPTGNNTEFRMTLGDNPNEITETDRLTIGASDWATGTWIPRFTVMSSGNVGINTPAPAETLEVVGNARISGSLTVGGANVLTTLGGNGANLTGLNASQLTSGTLPVAALPSAVVQLNTAQTLTGKTLQSASLTGTTIASGSVAIQAAAAQGALTVGVGQVTAPQGTASAPTYTFNNNLNTGFYSSGTNSVSISTNGVERLRISGAGNLASDDFANLPGAAGNSSYKSFHLASPVNNGSVLISIASKNYSTAFLGNRAGDFIVGNEGARAIIFKSGMIYTSSDTLGTGSEQMRIDSSGRVGIGTNIPAAKLDVNGNVNASGALAVGGSTVLNGDLAVNGLVTKLRVARQGDIDMGEFTASPSP
jgi:fibronectin-binding autotransporter adhesin